MQSIIGCQIDSFFQFVFLCCDAAVTGCVVVVLSFWLWCGSILCLRQISATCVWFHESTERHFY